MDHFDRVRDRHKNPDMQPVEDVPLAQNEFTKQFK